MIPEGWKFCKINELNQYITSGSRGWAQYYSDTGNLFVRITNLTRERLSLDLSDSKYVKIPENNSDGKRTRLMTGDILISITADLGIIGFIEYETNTPIYINQHIALLRIKEKGIHNKFVAYQMASEAGHKQFLSLNDAGAKSGLNLDSIRIFQIIIPPLPEQCKIAEILGAWDDAIALLEKLIAAKRKLKQGLMQQLLTGKKRFKEFEGSEWKNAQLGNVCKFIKDGTHGTHERFDDGIPLLSATNITESGQVCFDNASRISEKDYKKIHTKYEIQDHDVLLTVVGTLGRSAIVKNLPRFTLQRSVAIIRVDDNKIKPLYLYCISKFSDFQNQLKTRANITAQAGVYLGELEKIDVMLPSEKEQEKIASVLSAADTEISNLEKQLAAYKQQKRGLMQQLLTGKTRVRVN
jgi:type I restriction enzyme, S subunit